MNEENGRVGCKVWKHQTARKIYNALIKKKKTRGQKDFLPSKPSITVLMLPKYP